jgi:hypothetical protein
MTTTINSLNAYSYQDVFSSSPGGGKLFVPVRPSMVVHAQFDHVAGIPAAGQEQGVSISKIQIMNALIDQLISFKQSQNNPYKLAGAAPQTGQLFSILI